MVKIEESLAYGLPTSWLEWTSEARVEIAVRLDRYEDGPRFYNFLPMGEDATAPFVGHINAPFYTKASREDLRLEIPINSFFLGEAGKLCARAILELSTSDKSYAPTAATDFLTWTGKYYEVIEAGFQSSGTNIRNAEIVPLSQSQNGTSWRSLSSTYRWNSDGLKIITTRQVCQSAGAAIVTDELGLERIERLQKFAEQFFSVGIEPPAELIADWIEKIAKKLAKKSVAHTTWEKFYDDVARCLTSRSDALKGRYILLSDDSHLLPCGEQKVKGASKRKSIVFFQPGSARDDTDIEGAREPTLKVPASLNRYFSFIHPALRWHSQLGRRRTNKPSLNFFRDERLIQPYNVAAILESIAELLKHTRSDTVRRKALIWAFRNRKLLAQSESPNLDEVNLRVPATKNWILANEAFFSGDWDTLQGKRLEALLRETERFSQELQSLKDRLLASLKDWDLPGDTADWKEFLLEIGVRDGI